MEKTDLKKQYKTYYTATAKATLVRLDKAFYLSLCGKGDPSGDVFAANVKALYSTAYTLKFSCKAMHRDFVVPPLEGLWSFDEQQFPGMGMTDAPARVPREAWSYRLLLRLPDGVTEAMVRQAVKVVAELKGLPAAQSITRFELDEQHCVQVLHRGPFSEEPASLALLQTFMQEHNLAQNGLHHEIYLSDFRKTAPEKLKTILREPVRSLKI